MNHNINTPSPRCHLALGNICIIANHRTSVFGDCLVAIGRLLDLDQVVDRRATHSAVTCARTLPEIALPLPNASHFFIGRHHHQAKQVVVSFSCSLSQAVIVITRRRSSVCVKPSGAPRHTCYRVGHRAVAEYDQT